MPEGALADLIRGFPLWCVLSLSRLPSRSPCGWLLGLGGLEIEVAEVVVGD